ncbi:diphthine synthase, partial [Candidatus Woesearchaeota archaeon]|nr:diphthine synthase [Candidatus Woesearchaeota archaeon]
GKKRKDGVVTEDTFIVGCARLGAEDVVIKAGKAKDLLKVDFGKPLHCLIIPGALHFKEEEMLRLWK